MTQDEMEIENKRYLADAFFVLPLESGRIALLTPRRDLFKIVDSWEEAKLEGPKAEAHARPLRYDVPESTVKKLAKLKIDIDI